MFVLLCILVEQAAGQAGPFNNNPFGGHPLAKLFEDRTDSPLSYRQESCSSGFCYAIYIISMTRASNDTILFCGSDTLGFHLEASGSGQVSFKCPGGEPYYLDLTFDGLGSNNFNAVLSSTSASVSIGGAGADLQQLGDENIYFTAWSDMNSDCFRLCPSN